MARYVCDDEHKPQSNTAAAQRDLLYSGDAAGALEPPGLPVAPGVCRAKPPSLSRSPGPTALDVPTLLQSTPGPSLHGSFKAPLFSIGLGLRSSSLTLVDLGCTKAFCFLHAARS